MHRAAVRPVTAPVLLFPAPLGESTLPAETPALPSQRELAQSALKNRGLETSLKEGKQKSPLDVGNKEPEGFAA
jgi:hypothetical protein